MTYAEEILEIIEKRKERENDEKDAERDQKPRCTDGGDSAGGVRVGRMDACEVMDMNDLKNIQNVKNVSYGKKEYILPDGRTAIFRYDHNGVGEITVESMDMLMDMLIKSVSAVLQKERQQRTIFTAEKERANE